MPDQLTITRGIPWRVEHSVYDDVEETIKSDLRGYEFRCQIRGKVALGQEYPLVTDVTFEMIDGGFSLSLNASQTKELEWGDYLIDVVSEDGYVLMGKESIKVVGHVTLPVDPDSVMDFSETFLGELE